MNETGERSSSPDQSSVADGASELDPGADRSTDAPATAILAETAPARTRASNYPEPFAQRMVGRRKQPLGDLFGLVHLGINRTTLEPGGQSSLMHAHAVQEEFVYILEGRPTLVTENGEYPLEPGMCAGFVPAGAAHHLVNRTDQDVVYLEIGDRRPGDTAHYPQDDLAAVGAPGGGWRFTRKNGEPW